ESFRSLLHEVASGHGLLNLDSPQFPGSPGPPAKTPARPCENRHDPCENGVVHNLVNDTLCLAIISSGIAEESWLGMYRLFSSTTWTAAKQPTPSASGWTTWTTRSTSTPSTP